MERGRGRGKKEKRNRSRSLIGIGGKRRETTIDSDKDMQDSCNTSFEDVEEHESADISSKTIPSNTELTVNSGHISEKKIVASQNITEQSSVVKDNNSNKPGKAYIIDTTKSNQQNAEIFYNIEDRLINKSKIDSDSLTLLLKNKLIRYEESTIGECKITCKLTADKITVSKGKNYLKILAWFNNNKIFPLKINMIKYNLAEAIFSNCNEANLCLDTMDRAQTNDKSIIGFINNKSKFWRGVITDWPYDIPQLWQEIINKDEVTKMERMFRRVWNKEEKVMMNKKTNNIIITMKGSQLKENITIFENLQYKLKVRPYIEPVKQCYNCFKYGHIKSLCKSQTACINCGETAHGECNKITKCRNCGLEHKSTYRKCPIFEKNKIIKTIMAYNNVTFYETERILSGTEDKSIQYDRYSKPNTWPQIRRNNDKLSSHNIENSPNKPNRQSHARNVVTENQHIKPPTTSGSKQSTLKNVENANIIRRKQIYKEYYNQFNKREESITREKRGLAIRQCNKNPVDERPNNSNTVNTESPDMYLNGEDNEALMIQFISSLESSQDFKKLMMNFFQNLSNPAQLDIVEQMEIEEVIVNNEELRRREREFQEELNRAKNMVSEIKKKYWNNRDD